MHDNIIFLLFYNLLAVFPQNTKIKQLAVKSSTIILQHNTHSIVPHQYVLTTMTKGADADLKLGHKILGCFQVCVELPQLLGTTENWGHRKIGGTYKIEYWKH